MESVVLDPFGDYDTAGYLRNVYGERNIELVGRLETALFEQEVLQTVRYLRRRERIGYEEVTETHRRLFISLYPWAGTDRSITAPTIAIVKGGYKTLFAHPADCRRAAEHALRLGQEGAYLRSHPGEVFGYLAYAHPFLEGNGRTILTIFAELTRRVGFHIQWEALLKHDFLTSLTDELLRPGRGIMDSLLLPCLVDGVLSADVTSRHLQNRFRSQRT